MTSFRGRTPFVVVVVGRVAPFREDQRAFKRRRRRRLYIYIGDGFVKSGDDDEMFGRFKRGPRGGGRQNNEELASVLYIPRLVSFRLSPRVSFKSVMGCVSKNSDPQSNCGGGWSSFDEFSLFFQGLSLSLVSLLLFFSSCRFRSTNESKKRHKKQGRKSQTLSLSLFLSLIVQMR